MDFYFAPNILYIFCSDLLWSLLCVCNTHNIDIMDYLHRFMGENLVLGTGFMMKMSLF